MFIILVVIFVLGYLAIALEHPIKVEKAASALLIGSILWALYALFSEQILALGFSPSWEELKLMAQNIVQNIKPAMDPDTYATSPFRETVELAGHANAFVKHELGHHLIEIAEILFFLFGAMTIVEVVDQHQGFTVITDKIQTLNKVKLLWIIGFITFFMSAVLDNLTTTIVMIALLRKLISDKPTRWFFASIIVISANAGGAWSPIGDVTTIMLWIGGQITTVNSILKVFLPSLVNMIVPLTIVTFMLKGDVKRPEKPHQTAELTTPFERSFILILGVSMLLFVPVFKTVTHLPPYVGMLFGLGILWLVSEIMHREKEEEIRKKLTIFHIVKKVDTPTIFFFLGILSAVETVNPSIPSTLDAAALCKMAERGQITGGILDGPLAFDNAISAEAARIKKIRSEVSGDVDILLAPDLESANMLFKQLTYLAGAEGAGIVLGTRIPVVLTSRADTVRARLASAAVMAIVAQARRTGTVGVA